MGLSLRWRREPRETGLRGVAQGLLGWELRYGDVSLATVSNLQRNVWEPTGGWYWVAGYDSNVPHKNTHREPVATDADAKAACLAYVKAHFKAGDF